MLYHVNYTYQAPTWLYMEQARNHSILLNDHCVVWRVVTLINKKTGLRYDIVDSVTR
jgi:hypothetical protein